MQIPGRQHPPRRLDRLSHDHHQIDCRRKTGPVRPRFAMHQERAGQGAKQADQIGNLARCGGGPGLQGDGMQADPIGGTGLALQQIAGVAADPAQGQHRADPRSLDLRKAVLRRMVRPPDTGGDFVLIGPQDAQDPVIQPAVPDQCPAAVIGRGQIAGIDLLQPPFPALEDLCQSGHALGHGL